MNTSTDYYSVLGVLPSIDLVALDAVYRALLKKYHPDVYTGAKEYAENRTREIIDAYATLGDSQKRSAYDAARKNEKSGSYRPDDPANGADSKDATDLSADWAFVQKYYPDTERRREELAKISKSLALTFQLVVLSRKQAADAGAIAGGLQTEFFKRYFGENAQVHNFVRDALLQGRHDVAQEVNRAIKILGSPALGEQTLAFEDKIREATNYTSLVYAEYGNSAIPSSASSWNPIFLLIIVAALLALLAFSAHQ